MKISDETKPESKKNNYKIIFAVGMSVFLVIAGLVIWQAIIFNSHRKYFKQPLADQQIQEWMTFRVIEKYYNINLENVLHKPLPFSQMKMKVSDYCAKEKLDCNKFVTELETYKDSHP
jgi:hypothetical protein